MVGLAPDFQVLEFAPTRKRDMWTYATCGMSSGDNKQGLELHLFASEQSDSHVELLTVVAHFHLTESRLGLHHVVNFGRPWVEGSKCSFGFVSLPYLDGPSLENLDLDKGRKQIKCLWLIPITATERAYVVRYGAEALEAKFDEGPLDYLDSFRSSLA